MILPLLPVALPARVLIDHDGAARGRLRRTGAGAAPGLCGGGTRPPDTARTQAGDRRRPPLRLRPRVTRSC